MATQYLVFFGTTNAGGAPSFTTWARGDTHEALLPQPTFTDAGGGLYTFSVDWAAIPSTTVEYVAVLNGVELFDTLYAEPTPGTITVTAPTLNPAMWANAGDIINRAAVQCGLAKVADPFASADPNFVKLCDYLQSAADDLQQEFDWTHLLREATFTTDGVRFEWTLPADFHEMSDQTGWNRSARLPLIGPVSSQQVSALKARLANVLINVAFRLQGGVLTTPTVAPAGSLCAFEYVSMYWVAAQGATTATKAEATRADDLVLFDEELMILAVKLRYLEDTGQDTSITRTRYDEKVEGAIGKNAGAPVLSLGSGGRSAAERMINGLNVPIGNWN